MKLLLLLAVLFALVLADEKELQEEAEQKCLQYIEDTGLCSIVKTKQVMFNELLEIGSGCEHLKDFGLGMALEHCLESKNTDARDCSVCTNLITDDVCEDVVVHGGKNKISDIKDCEIGCLAPTIAETCIHDMTYYYSCKECKMIFWKIGGCGDADFVEHAHFLKLQCHNPQTCDVTKCDPADKPHVPTKSTKISHEMAIADIFESTVGYQDERLQMQDCTASCETINGAQHCVESYVRKASWQERSGMSEIASISSAVLAASSVIIAMAGPVGVAAGAAMAAASVLLPMAFSAPEDDTTQRMVENNKKAINLLYQCVDNNFRYINVRLAELEDKIGKVIKAFTMATKAEISALDSSITSNLKTIGLGWSLITSSGRYAEMEVRKFGFGLQYTNIDSNFREFNKLIALIEATIMVNDDQPDALADVMRLTWFVAEKMARYFRAYRDTCKARGLFIIQDYGDVVTSLFIQWWDKIEASAWRINWQIEELRWKYDRYNFPVYMDYFDTILQGIIIPMHQEAKILQNSYEVGKKLAHVVEVDLGDLGNMNLILCNDDQDLNPWEIIKFTEGIADGKLRATLYEQGYDPKFAACLVPHEAGSDLEAAFNELSCYYNFNKGSCEKMGDICFWHPDVYSEVTGHKIALGYCDAKPKALYPVYTRPGKRITGTEHFESGLLCTLAAETLNFIVPGDDDALQLYDTTMGYGCNYNTQNRKLYFNTYHGRFGKPHHIQIYQSKGSYGAEMSVGNISAVIDTITTSTNFGYLGIVLLCCIMIYRSFFGNQKETKYELMENEIDMEL